MAALYLRSFGSLALLRSSSDSLELLGSGKPAALLAYLDASPRQEATREHLVNILWADSEPAKGRNALRQTLWYIRKRADDVIDADDETLRLAPGMQSDRRFFIEAIDAGDYAGAVALYIADFIPAFGAPGCADFEHWADRERDRLRALFVRANEMIVRDTLTSGDSRRALTLARHARDLAPQFESNWRLVLEALVSLNDSLATAAELERLKHHLSDEGTEPDSATSALVRVLMRGSDTPIAAETSRETVQHPGDLVGRQTEFAAIISAHDRTRSEFAHIHITAPAGLGKTRLLRDVERRLRALRARVVALRALHGERDISFAFCAHLAVALAELPGAAGVSSGTCSSLVALAPVLSSTYNAPADQSTGDEAARRRLLALAELISAASEERPLALLLDDMHWLDEASRHLITALFDQIHKQRVLLVTASRLSSGPLSATTRKLALNPLTETEVLQFFASFACVPDEPWAADFTGALRAYTAGSPLLVVETVALARDKELLTIDDGTWRTPFTAGLMQLLHGERAIAQRIHALPRTSLWLLQILSIAGVRLSLRTLVDAGRRPEADVRDELEQLERTGFVSRDGDGWVTAHDEIAEEARQGMTREAVKAARSGLGVALISGASIEPERTKLAARQLWLGEDRDRVRELLRASLRQRAAAGDTQNVIEVAAELVGESPDSPAVAALVRSLPWRERGGRRAATRVAAGAALVALGAAAVALMRPPPSPDDGRLLLLVNDNAAAPRLLEFPLRTSGWSTATLRPEDARVTPLVQLDSTPPSDFTEFPDGSIGYKASAHGPSGTSIDALILRRDGRPPFQLTNDPADDGAPEPSPDGRLAALETARWDRVTDHTDIAVVDLKTRGVRALTRTSAFENDPRWSPDGSRIAFTRMFASAQSPEICVIAVDGTDEHCVVPQGRDVVSALAWDGTQQVLVTLDSAGTIQLGRMSLSDGAYAILDHTHAARRVASRDGKWVACECRRGQSVQLDWYVHPTDRPDLARLVRAHSAAPTIDATIAFGFPENRANYVDRLRIGNVGTIHPGQTLQLRATGFAPRGDETIAPYIRWSSLDPSVALVTTDGKLTAQRMGTAIVIASAGGWRADTSRVNVGEARARQQLAEDWNPDTPERWLFFGEPLPKIVPSAEGPAFWNAGDGDYSSGAVLRKRLSAKGGIGLSMRISLPLTRTQWQVIGFRLMSGAPSDLIATMDLRTGVSGNGREPTHIASFALPSGEAGSAIHRLQVGVGGDIRAIDAEPLLDGHWFSTALQCFTDGRCALAVEGKVVWRSATATTLPDSLTVVVAGNSVATKALVGKVRIWEGVNDAIDWEAKPVSIAIAAKKAITIPR